MQGNVIIVETLLNIAGKAARDRVDLVDADDMRSFKGKAASHDKANIPGP